MRGRSAFAIYSVLSLVLGWLVAGVHPDVLAPGPGEVVRYRIEGRAGPLAVGGGAAWVIAPDDGWGVLWRIDESTGAATRLAPTRGSSWPTFGEGYAWAPCAGTTDNPCGGPLVLKIDPSTGAVLGRISVPSTGRIATGLGAVWVPGSGVSKVDIEPARVATIARGRILWAGTSQGSLWTGSEHGIEQRDPADGSILRSFEVEDPCLYAVASDAIWAETCRPTFDATGTQSYRFVRIDAATGVVQRREIAGLSSIVAANGRLWTARVESSDQATAVLGTVDPTTLLTTDRLSVPFHVTRLPEEIGYVTSFSSIFLAADADSIWLSNLGGGEVVRVGIPT